MELAKQILTENILPYWMDRMKDPSGGVFGRIDGKEALLPDSERGAILCGRTLWTFSAAFRVIGNTDYLEMARHMLKYLTGHFIDREFGGVFWSLDAQGNPLDTKKQFYALSFCIYGLSEYARAIRDRHCYELADEAENALQEAIALYHCIDAHSRDTVKGGYFEACTRDWRPIDDMRLSDKDENEAKTMNSHLHILEAYASLLRIWDDALLRERLNELVEIFLDRILDKQTFHLGLFFDEDWVRKDTMTSYGHDIEASWLLREAAEIVGDAKLISRANETCSKIAIAALEGQQRDGSMIYEIRNDGTVDRDRHWWVQAETVVGCHWNGLHVQRDACLKFITENIIDWENGEWHWSIREDGSINLDDDKAGFWKCPYHNSRMCLELLKH